MGVLACGFVHHHSRAISCNLHQLTPGNLWAHRQWEWVGGAGWGSLVGTEYIYCSHSILQYRFYGYWKLGCLFFFKTSNKDKWSQSETLSCTYIEENKEL